MGVCTKERKGGTAAVLTATPCTNCTLIHWEVKVGGRSMKDVMLVRSAAALMLRVVYLEYILVVSTTCNTTVHPYG